MLDKGRLTTALRHKVDFAKGIDRDFVYIPVWQAKDLVEYLEPMKPRKTIRGYLCDRCGHQLVNTGYISRNIVTNAVSLSTGRRLKRNEQFAHYRKPDQ